MWEKLILDVSELVVALHCLVCIAFMWQKWIHWNENDGHLVRPYQALIFVCAASLLIKHGKHVFVDIDASRHRSEEESGHVLWVHRPQRVEERLQSAHTAGFISTGPSDVIIKCTLSLPVKCPDVVSTLQLLQFCRTRSHCCINIFVRTSYPPQTVLTLLLKYKVDKNTHGRWVQIRQIQTVCSCEMA